MTQAQPNSLQLVQARILPSIQSTVVGNFHQLSFVAMSTVCQVKFICADHGLARQFQEDVWTGIARFEAQYSRFIPDSLIGRINSAAGSEWVEVDSETETLLDLCQEMVVFTRGAFDPTALPLIRLWNWKAKPSVLPPKDTVAETLELVGWNKVLRRRGGIFLPQAGMALDLGAIGKEYAVDCIITLALERGLGDILVDFGQDLRVHGNPPDRTAWLIGLEDPKCPGKCWTGLALNNHAVATSGDYVRNFTANGRRYGHIIDPRDGYPANTGCLSASVIAPRCTLAGVLSTAAIVLGPNEGLAAIASSPGVEGAIITESSSLTTGNFGSHSVT